MSHGWCVRGRSVSPLRGSRAVRYRTVNSEISQITRARNWQRATVTLLFKRQSTCDGTRQRRNTLKIFATVLCLALAAGNTVPLRAAPMTQLDRERLIAHFQMTGAWLQDEVAHLSQAQLEYRAAPDKWSIAEVVQHLVVAEPNYWELFQKGMHRPRAAGFKSKASDADVLWYGIDRTRRQKTSTDQDPHGQTIQVAEALAHFAQLRDTMLEYAKTTNDDLRGHDVREWSVDAYQWFLEISTHSQRHILQIREIKADPGFPKS